MLIKFKKPDPRDGQTVRMDSSRGQYFIDTGAADQVEEGVIASTSKPLVTPPTGDDPTISNGALVVGNAADVIASLSAITDRQVLSAALAAEQAETGKQRKTVIEALTARLAEVQG